MARVLKGSHSFTCTPRVHPLTERTIPACISITITGVRHKDFRLLFLTCLTENDTGPLFHRSTIPKVQTYAILTLTQTPNPKHYPKP